MRKPDARLFDFDFIIRGTPGDVRPVFAAIDVVFSIVSLSYPIVLLQWLDFVFGEADKQICASEFAFAILE